MKALLALLGAVPSAALAKDEWTLVWSDEFDGDKIDSAKWGFDVDCWGGGNNERQCYTDRAENAGIVDGRLVITARHERVTGPALPAHLRHNDTKPEDQATREFSSARLTTRGKASWRYGKIAVRARLPSGQGTWPAIWMLPEKEEYGPWPASGEIDILEAVNLGAPCANCASGYEDRVLGTLHFGGKWPQNRHRGAETALKASDRDFHIFAVEWSAGKVSWFVDDERYSELTADIWRPDAPVSAVSKDAPFDKPFHIILNLAIGGGLPESRNEGGVSEDGFPKQMMVDWVRVYQCETDLEYGRSCLD